MPEGRLELIADRQRNHELVDRLDSDTGVLYQHLLEGPWTVVLRNRGRVSSLPFEITRADVGRTRQLTLEVPASGPVPVVLQVRSGERAVEGGSLRTFESSLTDYQAARFGEGDVTSIGQESGTPGTYIVEVDPEASTTIEFRTATGENGFQLFVPNGVPVPSVVQLDPIGSASVRVFEPSGELVYGTLELRWDETPLGEGAFLRAGLAPRVVEVGGVARIEALPVGTRTYRIDRPGTEQRALRLLQVTASLDEFTPTRIDLAERRTLSGFALRPDGTAAAGAFVQLLPRDQALVVPFRERDPNRAIALTTADSDGRFDLDVTGLDLSRELSLVADLDGWVRAIEDPV